MIRLVLLALLPLTVAAQTVVDPVIAQYVDGMGRKLALAAGSQVALKLHVVFSDMPVAITEENGACSLTTKLILTAESEAELAGVIAHQLGHIVLGPSKVPPNVSAPTFLPPASSGLCVRGNSAILMPMGMLKEQRDLESQADLMGLDYMDKAGYDPRALADFYQRAVKGSLAFPTATRKQADALGKQRSYVVNTSEFRDIQARVANTVPPHGTGPSLRK